METESIEKLELRKERNYYESKQVLSEDQESIPCKKEEGANLQDDEAFSEIEDILSSDPDNQEKVLNFRVRELQKICETLTMANNKLLNRIEQLQQQLENKNINQTIFTDEYSDLQIDFNDIEDMIKEYRTNLKDYQQKVKSQMIQKNQIIQNMNIQIHSLSEQILQANSNIKNLQYQNSVLQSNNQELLNKYQKLENNLTKSKNDYPCPHCDIQDTAFDSYALYNNFQATVENQLQKLIEKLIKQLQKQRILKKKAYEQIKRMQKNDVELENIIKEKNNKIYALEITALKDTKVKLHHGLRLHTQDINREQEYNRQSLEAYNQGKQKQDANRKSSYEFGRQQYQKREPLQRQLKSQKQEEKTSRNSYELPADSLVKTTSKFRGKSKIMPNFNLMELMNKQVQISVRQRYVVAQKIIDFFLKKIQRKDYALLMPQGLMVCNLNKINSSLIQIRKNTRLQLDEELEGQETSQGIVWNLGFILDSLLNAIEQLEPSDQQLVLQQRVSSILQKNNLSQANLTIKLKECVQQVLKRYPQ